MARENARSHDRAGAKSEAAEAETTAASDVVSEGWAVMPTRVIREGRDADLEQCVALAIVAAPERSAGDWREALAREINSREHRLVVAESGGAISGYGRASLFEPEPEAPVDTAPRGYYLTGVFVHPSQRRTGIGAALTQARLDWISERAADAWFFANARNAASIALHERFGFEEVTRRFSFPGLRFDGGEGILFRLRFDHRT
jgi:ribosomal protein S18 acetylase RimI-like enzyme